MFGSGLSNFGQAYRIGDAQNPFFKMQGMLPQAGLQPGAIQGAGGPAPILGKPMLPPGVTPEMAMLPPGIPGLGAPLPVKPPAKPKPKPIPAKVMARFNANENRRDHSRGDGPGQRGLGGGRQSGGREPGADRRSFGG